MRSGDGNGRPQVGKLIGIIVAIAGCSAPTEHVTERVIAQAVLTSARMSPARVLENRAAADAMVGAALSSNAIEPHRFAARSATAPMLATDSGRQLFSLLVACALPAEDSVVAGDLEFFGEIGLARQWLNRELNPPMRRWVSACVFARISGRDLATVISMRGHRRVLHASPDERDWFALEEGAFFGDMFTPVDQPIDWNACAGVDQVATPGAGGLTDRVCATQDPAHPGLTMCGFAFAGKCADVCDPSRGYAMCRGATGLAMEVVTVNVQ